MTSIATLLRSRSAYGALAIATLISLASVGPARSAGNQLIAFTVFEAAAHGALYLSNEDGSGRVRLIDAQQADRADWSPNGEQLVFSLNLGEREIWTVNRDGSRPKQLTHNGGDGSGFPAWSPDGEWIAYETNPEKVPLTPFNTQIWKIHTDGTYNFRLAKELGLAAHPAWSPDSTRIAFTGAPGSESRYQIYVMNSDGSSLHPITTDPNIDSEGPAWSPDGKKIALMQLSVNQPGARLAVMNSDGSGLNVLTENEFGEYNYAPTWNSQGNRIAFGSSHNEQAYRLEIIDLNGSNRKTLIDTNAEFITPTFSPPLSLSTSGQSSTIGRVSGAGTTSSRNGATVTRRPGAGISGSSLKTPAATTIRNEPEDSALAEPPDPPSTAGRLAEPAGSKGGTDLLVLIAIAMLLFTTGSMSVWRHRRKNTPS